MTSSAPRRSRRKTALTAAATMAAAASLLTACPSNQSADPPASTTTTAPDIGTRTGEIRRFLNDAILAEGDALVAMGSGAAKLFFEFQGHLESIEQYQQNAEGTRTEHADVDGITGARREGDRIRVDGFAVGHQEDGTENRIEEIELVEEGGSFKLVDFRHARTGLKASQMIVVGDDDGANDDVEAKLLVAGCYPPGVNGGTDPVLQVVVAYTAVGDVPVALDDGSVKPPATPAIKAEGGFADTAQPGKEAKGTILFEGSAFDGATVTLEFVDDDGGALPSVVLSVPQFPDPRACRTPVEGDGETSTTRRSSGSTRGTR